MNTHPMSIAAEGHIFSVWYAAMLVLVAVVAVGCGRPDEGSDLILGVWGATVTNVEPPAILVVKFATNGQGALFGGQKGGLAIPFSYRLASDRIVLEPRMQYGGISAEVRYDRAADTVSWTESRSRMRLVRQADSPTHRMLDAAIGATYEIDAIQRAVQATGASSNLLEQFRKATNR